MRDLQVTPQFQKDWRDVPGPIREAVHQTTLALRAFPTDPRLGVKKLQGIHPPVWRIRIGSYRLVYSFTKTAFILHRIRLRKDVYRGI